MDTERIPTRGVLLSASTARLVGAPAGTLSRRASRGEVLPVRRGQYVNADDWRAASDRERHLLRMRAAQENARGALVFVRDSAAAVHRFPAYGRFGERVHVLTRTRGVSGDARTSRHHEPILDDDIEEVEGFLVTTRERTLLDVARHSRFDRAVGMLDAAIRIPRVPRPEDGRPVSREMLSERLQVFRGRRGHRAATAAIAFASTKAESLGESVSRVRILELGFEAPEEQVEICDADGLVGVSDFGWRTRRLRRPILGEFDGFAKYTRDQYAEGRSMNDIVWSEKQREDRLRRAGPGHDMARWIWDEMHDGTRLARILDAVGVPRRSR